MQWTPEKLQALEQRLKHWTFVVCTNTRVHLSAPSRQKPCDQPATLRALLVTLQHSRWRRSDLTPEAELTVELHRWSVTPALIDVLAALPRLPFPARVQFESCDMSQAPEGYREQLCSVMPACYALGPGKQDTDTSFEQRMMKAVIAMRELRS